MTRFSASSMTRRCSEEWWSNASATSGRYGTFVVMSPSDSSNLAVLDVLRMDEQDFVEQMKLLEQGSADEAVEVAARHEAVRAIERERRVSEHDSIVVRRTQMLRPPARSPSGLVRRSCGRGH
jgi:hypothetical protein